jgi:hypothetical protein
MLRVASAVLFLCAVTTAQEASAASAAVKAACRDDAMRLCMPVIRDEAKRRDCMRAHAADLSDACKAAIHANQ